MATQTLKDHWIQTRLLELSCSTETLPFKELASPLLSFCFIAISVISFQHDPACISHTQEWPRVGFLPEETYFFRDTRKKVEETYFFQFCPDKTGRNWTKLEKTMKMVRNAGKKLLPYLINYKRLS